MRILLATEPADFRKNAVTTSPVCEPLGAWRPTFKALPSTSWVTAELETIAVPDEPWTANVCFGGKDRDWLFITASKGLDRIQPRVKGVGSQ